MVALFEATKVDGVRRTLPVTYTVPPHHPRQQPSLRPHTTSSLLSLPPPPPVRLPHLPPSSLSSLSPSSPSSPSLSPVRLPHQDLCRGGVGGEREVQPGDELLLLCSARRRQALARALSTPPPVDNGMSTPCVQSGHVHFPSHLSSTSLSLSLSLSLPAGASSGSGGGLGRLTDEAAVLRAAQWAALLLAGTEASPFTYTFKLEVTPRRPLPPLSPLPPPLSPTSLSPFTYTFKLEVTTRRPPPPLSLPQRPWH